MAFLFLFLGVVCMWLGLSTYLGKEKYWWWSKSTPVVATGIVFGALPAALAFFLVAFIFFFESSLSVGARQDIALYLVSPLIVLAILLAIIQPSWLKPEWLQWLEEHHHPILHLLREEARKEDFSVWRKRIQTQEGLEEWVEEVRRKYKLDHPDQRFIGDPHAE